LECFLLFLHFVTLFAADGEKELSSAGDR